MTQFTRLLPLWALCGLVLGYQFSSGLSQYGAAIGPVLAIIMFAMGLTLSLEECRTASRDIRPILIGVILQFLLMPLLALTISQTLGLSTALLTGMILVGSAPGGTASNILAYLASGRVALSVGMTVTSTLLSVLVTPWLCTLYLGQVIEVDQSGMLTSIVNIIIVPVLAGVILNAFCPHQVDRAKPYLPALAVTGVTTAIALVIALNADALASVSSVALLAVFLHNSLGLLAGYCSARLCGLDISSARTVAIEVGTQNSGLAAALAIKHFAALAALPAALFSIMQNLLGTSLAGYWSRKRKV